MSMTDYDRRLQEIQELRELNAELLAKLESVVRYTEDPFSAYLPDLLNEIRSLLYKAEKLK